MEKKKKYQPTHRYELHALCDNPKNEMLLVGFADKRVVADLSKITDEQLDAFLGMVITLHTQVTDELFRRRPELVDDFNDFCKATAASADQVKN